MSFDFYQLDKMAQFPVETETVLEDYQEALVAHFAQSPEGQAQKKQDPQMGFWVQRLVEFGYVYLGITPSQMKVDDVDEILTDIFPRKISVVQDDDIKHTLSELVTFWQYTGREFNHPQAQNIIKFLRQLEPNFARIMNDPSKFGMAKSLLMMGKQAGYDMTSEAEIGEFFADYNAGAFAGQDIPGLPFPPPDKPKDAKKKKKSKRKMAKASKKKNRKKKK